MPSPRLRPRAVGLKSAGGGPAGPGGARACLRGACGFREARFSPRDADSCTIRSRSAAPWCPTDAMVKPSDGAYGVTSNSSAFERLTARLPVNPGSLDHHWAYTVSPLVSPFWAMYVGVKSKA